MNALGASEAVAEPVLAPVGWAGAADPVVLVTAETAGAVADVTAAAAEPAPELAFAVAGCVEAADPVDAADEGTEVAGLVPEPVLAVVGCAGAADPVVPVAAEVADAVTAEVAGAAADVGESAACACRDSPSNTATMPTVKIATCAARRAMCRNIGWDTKAPARSGEAARPDVPE